jgi:alpha-ketoglutarate-dependent taurine dioxygenase
MSLRSIQGARQRRSVDLSQASAAKVRPFDDNPLTPWVVEPDGDVDLVAWATEGAAEVNRLLVDRGAVLFRGFRLESADEFEAAATALTSDLYGGYGDLPREGASQNIYKSTPYPADQPILFHSESSHLASWPTRISFFCLTPSAEGGETPLADTREIADRLDPEVLAEFESKGLTYLRNFSGLDVSWQQFFQTEDPAEVERRCAADGTDYEWTHGGEQLRVKQPTAAVRNHPETGDRLFFNQIQLHHPYYLPDETRTALLSMVDDPGDLPRNVTFGDGTPISDEIAKHVIDVYWETCVMFPWQKGDIIMLDNMRTAHARMPFKGERRIAVAMAGMTSA